jgi:hypothetical protein
MFRKTLFALVAAGGLAASALVPTAASAHGFGFGGGHGHFGFRHFGIGFWGPGYVADGACYVVRRPTPWGFRPVRVCD